MAGRDFKKGPCLGRQTAENYLEKAVVMRRILNERKVPVSVCVFRQSLYNQASQSLLAFLLFFALSKSIVEMLPIDPSHTGTMRADCTHDKIINLRQTLSSFVFFVPIETFYWLTK